MSEISGVTQEQLAALMATCESQRKALSEMGDAVQAVLKGIPITDLITRTEAGKAEAARRDLRKKTLGPIGAGVGAGALVKAGAKTGLVVARQLAKGTLRAVGTILPVVSIVCGIALACLRYKKGDHWALILAELGSGAAGCFPVIGTAISLAIDGVLIVVDLGRCLTLTPTEPAKVAVSSVGIAYEALGIDISTDPDPTKECVDAKYREISMQVHPDRVVSHSDSIRLDFEQMQKVLNEAKTVIYAHHGWV